MTAHAAVRARSRPRVLALDRAGVGANAAAGLLGHTTEVFLSTYLPASDSAGIRAAAEALGRVAAAE